MKKYVWILIVSMLFTLFVGQSFVSAETLVSPDQTKYYEIVAKHSGLALDVYGGRTYDGTNIIQYHYTGGDNQQWKFESIGNGYYKIVNKQTGKVVDVAGAQIIDGANVLQWSDSGSTNQQFKLVDVGGGYVNIVARHSGKALDVEGAQTTDGANVLQWSINGADNQKWQLIETGNVTPTVTTVIHNFTTDGINSSFFSITGNLSTSKGTVVYNGLTLTQCLKMESITSVQFTTTNSSTLKLVFNAGDSVRVKVDGTSYTMTNGIVTVALGAGTHTITKTDVANLYYIELSYSSTSTPTPTPIPAPTSTPTATATPAPTPIPGNNIIIEPNGSISLQEAINSIEPGNTIYLRGGTYNLSSTVIVAEGNNGNSSNRKVLAAYGSEVPVLNFSSMSEDPSNRGIVFDGDYWNVKGITIERAGDNGMLLSGNNNIIEDCVFHANRDTGLQLSRNNTNYTSISQWPSNNLILNCESYDNCDSLHENADGFAPKLTCGEGNIFRGCISHHNIDDGWDLYGKSDTGNTGVVLLEDCISHDNGTLTDGSTSGNGDKNGFKLGSTAIRVNHIVRRCIAYNNGKHGFTDNGNTASIEFTNNTSYNNGDYNFHTRDGATHVFKNNISLNGTHTDRIVGDVSAPNALTDTDTNWVYTASSADFVTLTPGSNSNPTSNGFLNLASNSQFIDAGVTSTGISYTGSAPDLGAIESN